MTSSTSRRYSCLEMHSWTAIRHTKVSNTCWRMQPRLQTHSRTLVLLDQLKDRHPLRSPTLKQLSRWTTLRILGQQQNQLCWVDDLFFGICLTLMENSVSLTLVHLTLIGGFANKIHAETWILITNKHLLNEKLHVILTRSIR